MLTFLARAHHFSRMLAWLGGALILGSAFLVTVEVLLRKFFGTSIAGADEISGYAFGVATSLGFAFALLNAPTFVWMRCFFCCRVLCGCS